MIYKIERVQKDNGNYKYYDKFFAQIDDDYILDAEDILTDICNYECEAFRKAFPDETNFTYNVSNISFDEFKENKSIIMRYVVKDWRDNLVLYGIKNKETDELINCKSRGNKFFTRKSDAINKCPNNHKVVKYKLIEMEDNE